MKIFEGNISAIPSKPHTGLVGILAKHQMALNPSYNLQANLKDLHALARSIIEALGGKQGENGWEVEIALATVDIDLNLGASKGRVEELEKGLQVLGEIVQRIGTLALEARLGKLEQAINQSPKLNGGQLQDLYENLAGAMRVHEQKIEKLEQTLAAYGKVEPIEATTGEFDFSQNPVILELGARLANLERQLAPVGRKKGG